MPFGRKRVGGYGTGRQRKFASLQLARDAKASRVEFANEPAAAATTSSSSTITIHGASENGTQYLLEEIGVPRFLVEDETDADGDLSTVLVSCAVLPSLVANLLCTLCRKHTLSTQLCHQTVSMGLRRRMSHLSWGQVERGVVTLVKPVGRRSVGYFKADGLLTISSQACGGQE
ncbi:hypothetical protein LSAT2_019527 [Lamellibrachia satsuma]|nr:hypothetical protein LSAT2_019527 [Lamellibrachia satsuma]